MFKVLPIHRRTLDRLLHVDRVFWMNAFENKFHRRFRRSVILEDPRGFLGPADLTGRNAPAEAAGATYSLASCKEASLRRRASSARWRSSMSTEVPYHLTMLS